MRKSATLSLEGFDPDVLDAARVVAKRKGIPLEDWVASVVPADDQPNQRKRRRASAQKAPDAGTAAERFAAAVASLPVVEPPASDPAAASEPKAVSDPLSVSLAALMQRLDGIDRTINEEREARLTKAEPVGEVASRLSDIERQMAALSEQLAAPRPLGRRGRPAAAEVRDAVSEIRERQREIAGEPAPAVVEVAQAAPSKAAEEGAAASVEAEEVGVIAAMHHDLARRLNDAEEARRAAAAVELAGIQEEVAVLRTSVDGLATSRDVAAIEKAMEALADRVLVADSAEDLAALSAPVAAIRGQVERLGAEVAQNAFARAAAEAERLSVSIDTAFASDSSDRDALGLLIVEIGEMRAQLRVLAQPERVNILVESLQAVAAQIVDLQQEFAAEANAQAVPAAEPAPVQPAEAPRTSDGEIASIHHMLHTLADKVDGVGNGKSGSEGFDALEKQVIALADRIDGRGSDPALAGLERTMNDLLGQVCALRDEAALEATVERATRHAVTETIGESRLAGGDIDLGFLRNGLAELKAHQVATDQRMQATLDGVHGALDTLIQRLGVLDLAPGVARPAEAARAPSLDEKLLSTTSSPEPQAAKVRAPMARVSVAAPEVERSEELLEPGAGRPLRDRLLPPDPQEAAQNDIKSSFIAAARRAAQAAQAEVAKESALPSDRLDGVVPQRKARGVTLAAAPETGFRARIDKHRRTILLGLAAVVLALGALQAVKINEDAGPAPAPASAPSDPATAASGNPAGTPAGSSAADASKTPATAPSAAPSDPQTTQAIPGAGQQGANAPAKPALPPIVGMGSLTGDLANLPAGLTKLRQTALSGDVPAIYELAAREADGRGTPRDLGLAVKLYEKLASAGHAPAQYKLGGLYEKGSGVTRDTAQAKVWYGRAAEQGHARSMHNLAVIFAENPAANGRPDYATAASWFRRGAENGVRDSQYNLAVLYARGLGLQQDLVQSYAWFAAAAAQGDEEAGKKRDEVGGKLAAADLARANSIVAAYKPRKLDPAANEVPAFRDASGAMTLLGAPAPDAAATPQAKRI